MLILSIIIYSILIFPTFINVDFYFKKTDQRFVVGFSVDIFKIINILNGFAETKKKGIFIHYKKNKAKLIGYEKLLNFNSDMKTLKDYKVTDLNLTFNLGYSENIVYSIVFAQIIDFISRNLFIFFKAKKPYLKFNSDINIYEDKTIFNVGGNFTVNLNILAVTLTIIKILIGKIKNEK